MRLYYFPVAPNPTKVRLYLAEKAAGGVPLPLELVLVDFTKGEQHQPEHRRRNPRGLLPVLELDDGSFVGESLPIIEFLEELYPEPSLWGTTPVERVRARELERLADTGVLVPLANLVHATRSPLGLPSNPEVAAAARRSLDRNMAVLEAILSDGRPFVAGARPSVADATLAAALQFGRFGHVDLAEAYPHVGRWDAAYRRRDAVAAIFLA